MTIVVEIEHGNAAAHRLRQHALTVGAVFRHESQCPQKASTSVKRTAGGCRRKSWSATSGPGSGRFRDPLQPPGCD